MAYQRIFKQIQDFLIPDKVYISWKYKKKLGKSVNWKDPQTFTEKLQWIKLNYRPTILTECADKYRARDFVSKRIGAQVLKNLYGIYTDVNQIDLNTLPNSFVLKTTHGSGGHVVCKDKSTLDWNQATMRLKRSLHRNQYDYCREWCYKHIKPQIICEEYLCDEGKPLYDFNFLCFNGIPRFVEVIEDKLGSPHANMFDLDLNLLERKYKTPSFPRPVERPANFSQMLEYATILSKGFPFVRIDFNYIKDTIYFGEMTFYPLSGVVKFDPESFDQFLGSFLNLPAPLQK